MASVPILSRQAQAYPPVLCAKLLSFRTISSYSERYSCSGCAFKHICFKCDGNHRACNCNFRPSTDRRPAKSVPSTAKSANTNRIDRFLTLLDGYTPSTVQYLKDGFTSGFHLDYSGPKISVHSKNLLSATENPEAVDIKLDKELSAHRLAGPFPDPPFEPFHISPLGVVPKTTPGEYRLIHHLSFPKGSSVNSGISSEDSSVQYATIQDAIRFVKSIGKNCFLAKTDIKNLFRIIPIHPDDYPLLGIFWKGSFYYDKCMPMGCSSSCKIFKTFSTAVEWVARHKLYIPCILHLLDDFLIVALTESLCQSQLNIFLTMCYYLGIPIAPEKTLGPSQILSFAGIELDSCLMEARLPLDKVQKFIEIITDFLKRKKVTLQGSYRSWKVMEFYNFTFQAWKLIEFRWGSWKTFILSMSERQ